MIRILSVSVYKAKDNYRLYYESFKDKQLGSYSEIRSWRGYLERLYEEMMGYECRAYVTQRAKPEKEIDMMALFMNTAQVMGKTIEEVMSSSKRECVDVKKITCAILFDMDYNPMDIERELPFKNRLVYDYRTKIDDRMCTEPSFRNEYKDIKSKALFLTTGKLEE